MTQIPLERMALRRGAIHWADLGEPRGSQSAFRRPVLVVQDNAFNDSSLRTVLVAVITSNLRLAAAPGNVRLSAGDGGIPKDSVIDVSQLLTLDRGFLAESLGRLNSRKMARVNSGLRLVLGLDGP